MRYFIIDFDSTIVSVEALEELAKIALDGNPRRDVIVEEIALITKEGMEGKITFPQSLHRRLALFQANREHIFQLIALLRKTISPSLLRNTRFLKQFAQQIYIISGGFSEYVIPIVTELGIPADHVIANSFIFDSSGNITGFDKDNPLAQKSGKIYAVNNLNLKGEIIVVGDGYTDYQIREAGAASQFYAFTESIHRNTVAVKADRVIANFDELLYYFQMPRKLSYPKSKIKVLLLDNAHPNATNIFKQEGYQVVSLPSSLSEEELIERIAEVSIVGVGSRTAVTKKIIEHAPKLIAVARFGIGVNNIDLSACTLKGIPVFNAPFSNTRSVVELALGEMLVLLRRVFEKSEKLHRGIWDKSAKNCHEIRGKKLGIIGYGNIGFQIGLLAELLGMEIYYFDVIEKLALGKAKACSSVSELLKIADVITLHLDGRKENTNFIGEKEFAMMKEGVIIVNTSRGHIIDIKALAKYIKNGKVHGAALDVFPNEPKSNDEKFTSILQGLPNVILTPHIAGRSEEAQAHIAKAVPEKIIHFINTGTTMLSVNFPNLLLPAQENVHRLLHTHRNEPGVLANINSVLAKHKINIEGQYLKTNDAIGYVITDVDKTYDKKVIDALKEIPGTIRVRVLY